MTANAAQKSAEIQIYEHIGENWWTGEGISARKFNRDLKALGDINHITLRINSPGGAVFEGNTIYNILRSHPATVHVVIDGLAASIASIIAMAGDSIEMPENAYMMIHNPSSCICGESRDMRKLADMLDTLKEGLVATYVNRTGMDKATIVKMMDDETWMTAEMAVDMGFADKVTEPVKAAALFEPAAFGTFRHMPKSVAAAYVANGQDAVESQIVTEEKETPTMATQNPTAPVAPVLDLTNPEVQAAIAAAAQSAVAPMVAQVNEQRMVAVRERFTALTKSSNLTPAQATLFGDLAEVLMKTDTKLKFSVENDGSNEQQGTALEALFALAGTMQHNLLGEQVATESAKQPVAGQSVSAKGWTPDLSNVPESQAGCVGAYIMDQYITNVLMAKNPEMDYAKAAAIAEKDNELQKLIAQHDQAYKS